MGFAPAKRAAHQDPAEAWDERIQQRKGRRHKARRDQHDMPPKLIAKPTAGERADETADGAHPLGDGEGRL